MQPQQSPDKQIVRMSNGQPNLQLDPKNQATSPVMKHFKKAELAQQYSFNQGQSNIKNPLQQRQFIRTLPPSNIIPTQKVIVQSPQNFNKRLLCERCVDPPNTIDGNEIDSTELIFDSNILMSSQIMDESGCVAVLGNDSSTFGASVANDIQFQFIDEENVQNTAHYDNIKNVTNMVQNTTEECNCCERCKIRNFLILTKLTNIEDILEQNLLLKKSKKYDSLPKMPFSDITELMTFDASLAQSHINRAFTDMISALGGSSLLKSVSNIMETIITNETSKMISWTGANKTFKFSSTSMQKIIVDVIHTGDSTNKRDEIQKKIAEWLRRCGDRLKSEKKRNGKENAPDTE